MNFARSQPAARAFIGSKLLAGNKCGRLRANNLFCTANCVAAVAVAECKTARATELAESPALLEAPWPGQAESETESHTRAGRPGPAAPLTTTTAISLNSFPNVRLSQAAPLEGHPAGRFKSMSRGRSTLLAGH